MGFDGLAHRRGLPARVDDADARRLRLRPHEIGAPHALEKGAVFALEAIVRLAGSGEPLPRHVVGAVEDQRPVGPQAGVYRGGEPLDQLQGNGLARAVDSLQADEPAAHAHRLPRWYLLTARLCSSMLREKWLEPSPRET